MERRNFIRTAAAITALCCTASAFSAIPSDAVIVEEAKVIYETDFEDGDVSKFSPRGEDDTSVIAAEKDTDGTYMSITGRSEGWNGPQLKLDDICEPGVRYAVSLKAKAAWYNELKISLQYTPNGSDQAVYGNLRSAVSQGEWVDFKDVKFSFSDDVHDVYLYVEANDKVDLSVDDFVLKTTPVYGMESDIPGLKDVYADYFKIGGAVTADELSPKSTKDLILKHYNSITLGNELKPENMLDRKKCLELAEDDETAVAVSLKGGARSILNFCRDNNIPVRGHVLVWHSQTPGWFFKKGYDPEADWVDKETMLGRMENYIKGVFAVLEEEYPDVDFYAWDVVNEAWNDGGQPRKAGTYEESGEYSGWVGVFGDNSFIPYAFEYARKYAPKGTKLYYNDYNEYMTGKMDAICEMAEEIKAAGNIDGIGMQSHLNVMNNNTEEPFPTVGMYAAALDRYSKLGLDIQITEFDATLGKDLPVTDELLELQAKYYSDLMDAIVKHKDSVSAVVFWGTTDDQSWRAWGSPLLFNEDYTAKPCFKSIIDGIDYKEPAPTEPKPTQPKTEPATTEPVTTEPPVTETMPPPDTTQAPTGSITLEYSYTDKIVEITDMNVFFENHGQLTPCAISAKELEKFADYKVGDIVKVSYTLVPGNGEVKYVTVEEGKAADMRKRGDVNGDGDLNIMDVISFNKFLLGASELDSVAKDAADILHDSLLNSSDALELLKLVLEIE
jgi:endo-1,4-beta-xylanase